jgi:hypothetical protein
MPVSNFTLRFCQQWLAGEKILLKEADISRVVVPHYKELTVQALYSMVANYEVTLKHLPDGVEVGKKQPNRQFVFDIVNTLHPGFV